MILTLSDIHQLLQTYSVEILSELNKFGVGCTITLSIRVGDPDPCITVSVLPEQVFSLPQSITIDTNKGRVTIPLKVFGDYEQYKPLQH